VIAVKKVLKEAVAKIGCTFRDYRTSEGGMGGYKPRVYAREGEPCLRCRGTVTKKTIAQRSSFFCPGCQK
jgi:formamidopyrimidine-DNA glycosylase